MSDLINKTLQVMESNETSNIFTEAASTPSLGKLAADHAEAHQAAEEDGEHDKRPSIEKKITKHYGQDIGVLMKDGIVFQYF
jgi:PBP1b-binding outer membrane lipoprotein LpoB